MGTRYRYDERMAAGGVGTLVDLVRDRGERLGDLRYVEFLGGRCLTFRELLQGAGAYGGFLQARGLQPGDRVLLLYPTCPEFLLAFFGTLLAGGIPVPVYPPTVPGALAGYLERQLRIARDAGVACVLCGGGLEGIVGRLQELLGPHLPVHTTADIERAPPEDAVTPLLTGGDSALIQYTSGSTGHPRGVELSHGAILANTAALGFQAQVTPADRISNWLPLYHDMGLIGHVLYALSFGLGMSMMGPQDFLASPLRWLESMARGGGACTLTGAPNFAFGYTMHRLTDRRALAGLDLSGWRICYNGAEPISASLMERFAALLEPCGFRSSMFSPIYGLAENCLTVACSEHGVGPVVDRISRRSLEEEQRAEPAGDDDPSPKPVVSVGRAVEGVQIRVVGEDGGTLPDRHQGHILVAGVSLMKGYHEDPVSTTATLRDGWLWTGDLGYLVDGRLHVTGRSKDLIVYHGSKHHPQDLEEAACSVRGVRAGGAVAFGVSDADQAHDLLVVVVESAEQEPERKRTLAEEVTRRIAHDVGCRPDRVEVLPPKRLPKTSSGKLRRTATRQLFLQGRLGAGPSDT